MMKNDDRERCCWCFDELANRKDHGGQPICDWCYEELSCFREGEK